MCITTNLITQHAHSYASNEVVGKTAAPSRTENRLSELERDYIILYTLKFQRAKLLKTKMRRSLGINASMLINVKAALSVVVNKELMSVRLLVGQCMVAGGWYVDLVQYMCDE